ncbi:UNKNOWN [Stylonychia lemnae]|uniref:Uncharacterized protein n=1 Tax=Stylonychia lemnae TaxID=5949 RepID=A0A078AUX1_STYLE|nr:UNKNOWN [Stylonychia lemnae]|eukprot:CDW86004.1 UNKNOWN [Stylonychia lemnae]
MPKRRKDSELIVRQYQQLKRTFISNQNDQSYIDNQSQKYDYKIPDSQSRRLSTNVTSKEMSNFKSANTLRNSILSFRFPQGQRFKLPKKPDSSAILNQTDWVSQPKYFQHKKGSSFGFGNRELFQRLLKEYTERPAPTQYDIQSEIDQKIKNLSPDKSKCTFGLSYEAYKHTSDFDVKRGVKMNPKQNMPGPNAYSPTKQKHKSPVFTLHEKSKTCWFDPSKEILCKPPPNKYQIQEKLVKNGRFKQISLGYGSKFIGHYEITPQRITPGPGDYNWQEGTELSARPKSMMKMQSSKNGIDLNPRPRECSFAVEHSGEPFKFSGAIDDSPQIKTPISYQSMFDKDTELSFYKRSSGIDQFTTSRYLEASSVGSRVKRQQSAGSRQWIPGSAIRPQ